MHHFHCFLSSTNAMVNLNKVHLDFKGVSDIDMHAEKQQFEFSIQAGSKLVIDSCSQFAYVAVIELVAMNSFSL